jgi:hypothetical protein
VSRKARTRAAVAALVLLVAGGALTFGQASGTFAIFNAEVENQSNVLAGGWVPAPTGTASAVPTSSPYQQVALTWTAGANPPVTGQNILYADGGSGASASCGSYSSFSSPAAGVASSSVTGTNISDWWCFEITSSATTWTTDPVTFVPRRILVPTSVTLSNKAGQTVGTMEAGDTIKIVYNQAVTVGATVTVNSCATNTIVIGAACGAAGTIGTITGFTNIAHARTFASSTITGSGTTTVTITLVGVQTTTVTGGGTFTASGTGALLTSNASEGVCSTSPTCSAPSSGDF